MARASRFTVYELTKVLDDTGEDFPLSADDQLAEQMERFKDYLTHLEQPIPGAAGTLGILVAEDVKGRKCYISSSQKVYMLIDGEVFEISPTRAVDHFGVVEITKGWTQAVIRRLDEFKQIDTILEALLSEVLKRFPSPTGS